MLNLTDATQNLKESAALARTLDRKFEAADLVAISGDDGYSTILRLGAQEYAATYTGTFTFMVELLDVTRRGKVLSDRQMIGSLNCLRAEALRESAAPVRIAVEDAGVYVLPDGTVCRVKANRDKTRTYASRWVASHADRLMEAGQHEHGDYVYESGLVQRVAAEGRKMTLEEAKAHSVRFAQCVRCGRKLIDGRSVEAGLGPICIRWFTGA